MELGLKGKVAIVTGGTEGIGKATALRLAQEGAHVAICARRKELVDDVGAEIQKFGVQTVAMAADMSKAADIERFMHAVAEGETLVARVDDLPLADRDLVLARDRDELAQASTPISAMLPMRGRSAFSTRCRTCSSSS